MTSSSLSLVSFFPILGHIESTDNLKRHSSLSPSSFSHSANKKKGGRRESSTFLSFSRSSSQCTLQHFLLFPSLCCSMKMFIDIQITSLFFIITHSLIKVHLSSIKTATKEEYSSHFFLEFFCCPSKLFDRLNKLENSFS